MLHGLYSGKKRQLLLYILFLTDEYVKNIHDKMLRSIKNRNNKDKNISPKRTKVINMQKTINIVNIIIIYL